jgi:uncharacterized protein
LRRLTLIGAAGADAGPPSSSPWPPAATDLAALRVRGWRPAPIRQFVLKVHQRCNLACDYCYVYTLADQSWRDRPVVMTPEVWSAAARRIGEHVAAHHLRRVEVVLHGGEPLLAGTTRLTAIVQAIRAAVPTGVRVAVGMQTNGVLLTDRILAALLEQRIQVGVSLDGTAADNDAHRRNARGEGSYAEVERGLRHLLHPRYRPIYAGLLCTVDPATDPVATYEALLRFSPPALDVLIPHATWATRPPREGTPVGDWLVAAFDRWYDAPRKETRIRLFEAIIALICGGAGRSDYVGVSPAAVAVVETDGALEQTDALKSAYEGAAATGLSVHADSFDAMLAHPGVVARQIGAEALAAECQSCDIRDVCGGGHFAHRYRPDTGFVNASVYCQDMQVLIRHVIERLRRDVGDGFAGRSSVRAASIHR